MPVVEGEETGQKAYDPPRLRSGQGYFDATAPPTAADDVTQGFNQGSHWYMTDRLWICVDDSLGAAIWKEMVLITTYDVIYGADSVTYLGDQVTY